MNLFLLILGNFRRSRFYCTFNSPACVCRLYASFSLIASCSLSSLTTCQTSTSSLSMVCYDGYFGIQEERSRVVKLLSNDSTKQLLILVCNRFKSSRLQASSFKLKAPGHLVQVYRNDLAKFIGSEHLQYSQNRLELKGYRTRTR